MQQENNLSRDGRSAAEVEVKNCRAEVETARKRFAEAKASCAEASARVSAGGLDRDAIRAALLAEQVEQRVVENAEAALKKAETRLAESEAEADRRRRQAVYDRALGRLTEAEAAFRDKYAPSLGAVLDALAIAAAAENAVAEANANLPEGAEPFAPPFGFSGGAPRFLQITALDGRGQKLWTGDQFARPAR